jgi:hypothetical protein
MATLARVKMKSKIKRSFVLIALLMVFLTTCSHHGATANSPISSAADNAIPAPLRIPQGLQVTVPAGWNLSLEGQTSRFTLEGPSNARVILQVLPAERHTPASVIDRLFHEQLNEMVNNQALRIIRISYLRLETGELHYLVTRDLRAGERYTTIYACCSIADGRYLLTGIAVRPRKRAAQLLEQLVSIMMSAQIVTS